jgi:hypothetical protein
MTLRYSHLAPAHKAKALDRLGNAFKQIEQQQAEQQAEAANSSQTATNLECFRNVLLVRSGRGFSVIDPKSTPNQEINANSKLVEAGGIEPPSEGLRSNMTTCLADVLISLFEPPTAGSRRAIRFGSQPHPLRQENRPIPLNDVLANPVGESR